MAADTTAISATASRAAEEPSMVPSLMEDKEPTKIDEITAVQDSIDGLSLAMFEALRGLRDAVAPESGNIGASAASDAQDDFEEFWQLYRNGDVETVALVHKASAGVPPQNRDDAIRLHARIEMEKDTELVARLAADVLQKSADIDERVAALPGMNRTRSQQMERIQELIDLNSSAAKKLEEVHALATERRDQVRSTLREQTCQALGINEEKES